MNIKSKQITEIATSRMDITTLLGFFQQISGIITSHSTLASAMGTVWTTFTTSVDDYDDAYAQTRKWMQTVEIESLDKTRDDALRAFLNAIKAMVSSPNAEKSAAAKRVQFVRDKYSLSASDEYMKATTAVSQFVQELEANCSADLALLGLDDWMDDLKTKNQAFLVKMNERTAEQSGMQKGIVREKRLLAEGAYRDVVKLINAMAICEVPAGLDFTSPINRLNAEIEHYRQILSRKGVSTGTGSSGSGSDSSGSVDSVDSGDSGVSGSGSGSSDSGSVDSGSGSDSQGGGSDNSGSGSGYSGSGSGDSGSGSGSGGGGSDDSGTDGME